jgi:hypothetical protein
VYGYLNCNKEYKKNYNENINNHNHDINNNNNNNMNNNKNIMTKNNYIIFDKITLDKLIDDNITNLFKIIEESDLNLLNGCQDSKKCKCMFEHKNNRILTMRYNSLKDNYDYYSPKCNKIVNLNDIHLLYDDYDNSQDFINIYNSEYKQNVLLIIDYIKNILNIGDNNFILDTEFIIEPYDYTIYDGKNMYYSNDDNNDDNYDKYYNNTTKKLEKYDYVVYFVIDNKNISNYNINILNNNIIEKTINITGNINKLGYIIDQTNNISQYHTQYNYLNHNSKHNVMCLKFKLF